MKVRSVSFNNRRKGFEVVVRSKVCWFPYAKLEDRLADADHIASVVIDRELGGEGFTYKTASGKEGSVHMEQVLEYNQDPGHLRDLLLYRLTLEAQKRIEKSRISKRELIRRLGTSATQFYRLLDQTNYRKSVDQMLLLLNVLDCDVDIIVHAKGA